MWLGFSDELPSVTRRKSRSLITLRLNTASTQNIGPVPLGTRVTFPIGQTVGRRHRELDLRVTLETDDGALIHMTFEGIRDDGAPGAPYLRTLPRFETAEPKYSFLNRLLAVGTGEIRVDGPVHVIEELL